MIHGGEIYDKKVNIDFSVNINPYGPYKEIVDTIKEKAIEVSNYPDCEYRRIRKKLSEKLKVPYEYIIMTNGASEAFTAVVQAIRPETASVKLPCFYGYIHALKSYGFEMPAEYEGGLHKIINTDGKDSDIIFLANPNNPDGKLLSENIKQYKGVIVLDESFINLSNGVSYVELCKDMENLVIVRSFTKTFSMPGLRLGYIVCGNKEIRDKIKKVLPEWNVSLLSEEAGIKALDFSGRVKDDYLKITREKEYLYKELELLGFKVYKSDSCFILFETSREFKPVNQEILIRDCSNFSGLKKGFYRVSVRKHEENELLINYLKACFVG